MKLVDQSVQVGADPYLFGVVLFEQGLDDRRGPRLGSQHPTNKPQKGGIERGANAVRDKGRLPAERKPLTAIEIERQVRFYYDGAQVGSDVDYPELPDGGTNGYLMIGGNVAGENYGMAGTIDELRISSRAVTDTWISLEHASMNVDLVSPVMDP